MTEITVEVVGATDILRAFRQLPKEASEELREESKKLAAGLAADIEAAARREGAQAALMAQTVRVKRDRIPVVQAGGAKRVGRKRVRAEALLYATEYGSSLRQFRPKGETYWFYETVQRQDSEIYAKWLEVAAAIIDSWEGA